jgi:hypothetical protein
LDRHVAEVDWVRPDGVGTRAEKVLAVWHAAMWRAAPLAAHCMKLVVIDRP